MDKKYDIIPTFCWIALSIFVMVESYRLELGNFRSSGPGLMPFLIGIGIFLFSTFSFIRIFASKIRAKNGKVNEIASPDQVNFGKVGLVVGSLIIYALFMEKIGFLVSTFLVIVFLFRIAGVQKWRFIIAGSVLTIIATYVLFTFLGVRLPKGIFRV